jgi:DNA adenine methylase
MNKVHQPSLLSLPDHSTDEFQTIELGALWSRVERPNSTTPRSFLRWAGSKRFILKHVINLLPSRFRTYREPFLGSGSLFFFLRPERAVLNDSCSELIETFSAIRDNVDAVIEYLRPLKRDKETFYHIRQNRSKGRFKRAAEFIYLNKTCWNGLYRVNSAGIFNVPFGSQKSDSIVDFNNLRECAASLGSPDITLQVCDFENSVKESNPGDLVYFDPPYVTGHNNNGFIAYNEVIFSWDDQKRLANIAKRLASKGVHVIVSNANHQEIVALYEGFAVKHFNRTSTLASDITKRRIVSEVLLHSHN